MQISDARIQQKQKAAIAWLTGGGEHKGGGFVWG